MTTTTYEYTAADLFTRAALADSRPGLAVFTRPTRTAPVIVADGELDRLSAPEFTAYVHTELRRLSAYRTVHRPLVVVDLCAVRFLGIAGLEALLDAAETAHRHGAALRIVADHHPVRRALAVSGLAGRLRVYPTVEQAVR